MAELPAALAAALAGPRALFFVCVELVFPGGTVRLLDGSGECVLGGHVYSGRDPVYGVLDSIKGLVDGSGESAPSVQLGMIPASDTAMAALLDPAAQGSPAMIAVGVLDPATGLPVSEIYTLFVGEIDVPTLHERENDRRIEYTITSIAERLFSIEEGRRLSHAFHVKVWPGELGLEFVTDIETWVPWGQALNTTAIETRSNMPGLGGTTYGRT